MWIATGAEKELPSRSRNDDQWLVMYQVHDPPKWSFGGDDRNSNTQWVRAVERQVRHGEDTSVVKRTSPRALADIDGLLQYMETKPVPKDLWRLTNDVAIGRAITEGLDSKILAEFVTRVPTLSVPQSNADPVPPGLEILRQLVECRRRRLGNRLPFLK